MRERRWLLLILTLYLILGIGFSVLMPLWEAPDEHAHYLYALIIAREGRIPSPEENYEAYQPPLYYWLAAQPLRLLDRFEPKLVSPYFPKSFPEQPAPRFDWAEENYRFLLGPQLLRWLNLTLGGFALYLVYRAAQRFTDESIAVALATLALAGLTPQFLHITASVNNDALAILAGAFLFWLLGIICSEQLGWRWVAASSFVSLGLPALTKLTVLPIAAGVLLATIWRTRTFWHMKWAWLLGASLLAGLSIPVALAVLTPHTVQNLWSEIWWRGFYVRPGIAELSPRAVVTAFAWSYWGQVGWVAVGLPKVVIVVMSSLAILGALGSARLLSSRQRLLWSKHSLSALTFLSVVLILGALIAWWFWSLSRLLALAWTLAIVGWVYRWVQPQRVRLSDRTGWAMAWITVGLTLLVVTKNALTTPQYQGRFFFPSIGVLSLLAVAGWFTMLPAQVTRYLPAVTVLLMVALNLLLWFGGIIPVYYQPFLH